MKHLTDEELRRVRLAGNIARGLRGVLYLVVVFLIALVVAAIIIQSKGG